MKKFFTITPENIGYWALLVIYLIIHIIAEILPIKEENSFGIKIVTLGTISIIILFYWLLLLIDFLDDCTRGKHNFEIDLLKPFRRRTISPEDEDKRKK